LERIKLLVNFYKEKNHNPGLHQYIFKKEEYIGQLNFWSADEIADFGKLLSLTKKALILDIGSGLGGPLCHLVRLYNCKGIGVEITPHNFKEAEKRKRLLKLDKKVNFLLKDILEINFSDETFDSIISIDSMVHIKKRNDLLKNY